VILALTARRGEIAIARDNPSKKLSPEFYYIAQTERCTASYGRVCALLASICADLRLR
jgi:hypothetical protein